MKKLAGLVIILAVLILGGYYGMGIVTEKTIKKNIETINQSNGLLAEVEQYKRGFFCSQATIKWNLHVPERIVKDANGQQQTVAAQDYQMDMPVKIYHGPIIFADHKVHFGMGYAESVIPFPEKYNEQFNASFSPDSIKPQMDLSIFVNYLNKSSVNMNVPEFKLIAKDGNGQLEWKGMSSDTSITSGVGKVAGNFIIKGLNFSKDDSKVNVGKITTDYNLHETTSGIYLGSAGFSLPSFLVQIKDQKMFEISDFTLSSDSDIDNNLFSTHFSASLNSVFANGQSYGPGDIEISVRNLDAEVLAKINQQANAMQNGSDAERQQAMLSMLPQLPKLFAKGAEFEISQFKMKLPQGLINGNLFVSLPKGDTGNPFELMQKIHGTAKLTIPTAVVKQLMQQSLMQQMEKQPEMQQALAQQAQASQPQTTQPATTPEQLAAVQTDKQLAALEQTGLISVHDSDYVIDVSLDQGKFTVNGKPFDPSAMKF